MTGKFTGRHMFAILAAFFGVVIAVNFVMAAYASSTFGGLVVENSYVASQHFNRWLDEAEEESALGWTSDVSRLPGGQVGVALTGPGPAARLSATARHPLGQLPDVALTFERDAAGRFVSHGPLPEGRWTLRLSVTDSGTTWRREVTLQ